MITINKEYVYNVYLIYSMTWNYKYICLNSETHQMVHSFCLLLDPLEKQYLADNYDFDELKYEREPNLCKVL